MPTPAANAPEKHAGAEAALLLAVLFVGTDFVAVKYALEDVPPLALVSARYVIAGSLLFLLALWPAETRTRVRLRTADVGAMAGLGLVGITLNQVGYTVGLSLTSGSNAALIFATAPVWGLLLGILLGLERGAWKSLAGIVVSLAGVALVVRQGLGSPDASLPGDLFVCLSAFSWGAYAVLSLPILRRYDPLVVAAYSMLFGGLAAAPLAVTGLPGLSTTLFSVDWSAVSAGAWVAVGYSTVFASAFAFAAWQTNVARMGANKVLVYLYLVTLVGLTSSVLLLNEDLGPGKLAGAIVILCGVYLARRA